MQREFTRSSKGAKSPGDIAIFVDLDGVLSDFANHLKTQGKAKPDGNPKWDELDHDWWRTIPVFRGAKKFYAALKKLAPVKFLSAPTPNVDSFSGKAEWLQSSFLPRRGQFALLDLVLCSAKDKHFLAGPGRILIDDRIKNIHEWEAAGGIGVHHKGDFDVTLKAVTKAIADYNSQRPTAKPHVPEP